MYTDQRLTFGQARVSDESLLKNILGFSEEALFTETCRQWSVELMYQCPFSIIDNQLEWPHRTIREKSLQHPAALNVREDENASIFNICISIFKILRMVFFQAVKMCDARVSRVCNVSEEKQQTWFIIEVSSELELKCWLSVLSLSLGIANVSCWRCQMKNCIKRPFQLKRDLKHALHSELINRDTEMTFCCPDEKLKYIKGLMTFHHLLP